MAFAFIAIAGLALWGWFARSLTQTASVPRALAIGLSSALVSLAVFMLAFAYSMRGLALPQV